MNEKEIKAYSIEYFKDCELRKRLSQKTLKAYRIDVNQYAAYIGIDQDNTKKINDFICYLNHKYVKPKTIKRKLASIKAFYIYLEYMEIIESSPFHKIRTHMKEPTLLPKIISKEYLNQMFCLLHNDFENAKTPFQRQQALRNMAVIELLFSTGMRISELCSIKNQDLDLHEKKVKIFGKGSKERMIYIGNDHVVGTLQAYKDIKKDNVEPYFFSNKFHTKLSDQSVRNLINQLEKRLHFTNHITPHMFRHTFATTLLEKDVDIRYIQQILGHSSIAITQIYTHVSYVKQKEILLNKNPMNDYIDF